MQALGYRIYNTEHGFELRGYSRQDIETFSKRNREIVKAVKEDGLSVNARNKKDKVLTTRKAKSKSGKKLEEIQELWRAEAQAHRVGRPLLDQPGEYAYSLKTASEEVESAIGHLSERSVSFGRNDVYATVFERVGVAESRDELKWNWHISKLKIVNQ